MIEFEKAKVAENKQVGKKGVTIHKIKVVAQVTEASAKALGDDVRNTLYNSKGIIRPSFGQMDLTHAFADASFHLSVTGVKGAELRLDAVLAHRFRVAMRGDGDKKPKRLICAFEVEYINRATGASSIDLWTFVNSYINAIGTCRLKYPEQQPMFTDKKEEVVPGTHVYEAGKFSATIKIAESQGGWTSTRKAAAGDKKLPQKPGVESASESEALALAAYDVRKFADKIAGATRGKAKDEAAALSNWASGFIATPVPAETVPITRHTS